MFDFKKSYLSTKLGQVSKGKERFFFRKTLIIILRIFKILKR
jgi:hypothetical protein